MQNRRYLLLLISVILITAVILMVFELYRERAPSNLEGEVLTDIVYNTVDGEELKLDIYFPSHMGDQPLPAVIYVHGGAWIAGKKTGGTGLQDLKALVEEGFIGVSIDYRLAPKYKFPAQIQDVKCAIRFLRENADRYHIDPDRIGLLGSSAGGHLVALAGVADESAGFDVGPYLDQSSRVQAVVDMFGPADLTLAEGSKNMLLLKVFGSTDPKTLAEASPVSYITPDDPPFLIIHGDRDQTVSVNQSIRLYNALRKKGVEATLLIVENAGHGFKPEDGEIRPSREEITRHIIEFFRNKLMKETDIQKLPHEHAYYYRLRQPFPQTSLFEVFF